MTPEDVKMMNGISDFESVDENTIKYLIIKYKKLAEDYCNNKFELPYPSGVEKFIADCIKFSATGNISSRSMGSVSYSYITQADLPNFIYKPIIPYRKLKW